MSYLANILCLLLLLLSHFQYILINFLFLHFESLHNLPLSMHDGNTVLVTILSYTPMTGAKNHCASVNTSQERPSEALCFQVSSLGTSPVSHLWLYQLPGFTS